MRAWVIRSTSSHVMAFWLVFEASLTSIVPRQGTRLSKVVRHFKHAYLIVYRMLVQKEQMQSSREVDFVIKATLLEWQCYFVPLMEMQLG